MEAIRKAISHHNLVQPLLSLPLPPEKREGETKVEDRQDAVIFQGEEEGDVGKVVTIYVLGWNGVGRSTLISRFSTKQNSDPTISPHSAFVILLPLLSFSVHDVYSFSPLLTVILPRCLHLSLLTASATCRRKTRLLRYLFS